MARYPILIAAEVVGRNLKKYFFENESWLKVHREVSKKLSQLVEMAKPYYPDKDPEQLMQMLATYSQKDIAEAFSEYIHETKIAKEGKLCSDQPNAIGAHITHFMASS